MQTKVCVFEYFAVIKDWDWLLCCYFWRNDVNMAQCK